MGGDALILVLQFIINTAILYAIEKDLLSCFRGFSAKPIPLKAQNLTLDPDVIAEEERVRNNKNDVIRVCDFRKAYTTSFGEPFLAVERISFGLDYGECFALLGVNGAGKSTTFKSLTADTEPSEGVITVAGYNITTEFEGARKLIGYCPQKDAIFPLMTVEEHLWFYARIKGIPSHLHNDIVEKAILELNLADHREKPAGTLSGGNKRKLSVAMATLGNPPIILLDEPSAGMDPEARRFMWTVVERIS
jgi:ATP-binding cassette subfamily A (ABC1) protein 3